MLDNAIRQCWRKVHDPGNDGFFMKKSILLSLWARSLSIQASFNFRTLQGLGFLYALLPVLDLYGGASIQRGEKLRRHLKPFNTHPFMVPSVLGSIARLEEEGDSLSTAELKNILMGPYAGIGDVFFWGTLRVLASVLAVLTALMGSLAAPLALLLLHNPFQLWVRIKGFLTGYGWGKQGIVFVSDLALPAAAGRIRWLSLTLLGIVAAVAAEGVALPGDGDALPGLPGFGAALILALGGCFAIRKGLSQVTLLYGTALLCMVIAI